MTEVLLFTRARELAGTRRTELDGVTVAQVVAAAVERFGPEFGAMTATCTVVVDGDVVHRADFDTTPAGSELAILPPVSGGALGGHGTVGAHLGEGGSDVLRVAVVTVSDRASRAEYSDLTGPAIEALVEEQLGALVVGRELVPDESERISAAIVRWCDEQPCDLVLTNGGTGLTLRDVTPEATRAVLDVEAPGIAELMRSDGIAHTPLAALSRQVAGRRGHTMVVNLPGSVRGATEGLEAVMTVLPHAVTMARVGR